MSLSVSGDGHHVLLVDDEPSALRGYETQLLGDGITNVLTCTSGQIVDRRTD